MIDENTAHPDAMPVALLLYFPDRETNYEVDPVRALPQEDLATSYERNVVPLRVRRQELCPSPHAGGTVAVQLFVARRQCANR